MPHHGDYIHFIKTEIYIELPCFRRSNVYLKLVVTLKIRIMKTLQLFLSFIFLIAFLSCKKGNSNSQTISIPNGDFEDWDNIPNLLIWQTNSCPACVPPYETYIVQKVSDSYSGQFAAKFIYNNVYQSR